MTMFDDNETRMPSQSDAAYSIDAVTEVDPEDAAALLADDDDEDDD
jgi:hypothetical protein